MRFFSSCNPRHGMYAAAALLAAMSAGCGGDGAPAAAPSAANLPAIAYDPEEAAGIVSVETAGSARNGYEKAIAAYDRIDTPSGGSTTISKAEVAALQAAFDKLGDELSSL